MALRISDEIPDVELEAVIAQLLRAVGMEPDTQSGVWSEIKQSRRFFFVPLLLRGNPASKTAAFQMIEGAPSWTRMPGTPGSRAGYVLLYPIYFGSRGNTPPLIAGSRRSAKTIAVPLLGPRELTVLEPQVVVVDAPGVNEERAVNVGSQVRVATYTKTAQVMSLTTRTPWDTVPAGPLPRLSHLFAVE